MIKKETQHGYLLEIDLKNNDIKDVFICDGKISVIRFFYKKGIPLKFDTIKIGDNVFDDRIDFGTLDYSFILSGFVDVLKNFDFKKGDVFEFKQFSRENFTEDGTPYNFDSYRSSVEKIQLFMKNK